MTFELKLQLPSTMMRVQRSQPQYDAELDDVGAGFIARICSATNWPVTVRTDLWVVVEQLGDLLAALQHSQIGRLDFYEQGIERVVSFSPKDEALLIECSDMITKATSQPESVIVPRGIVAKELTRLAEDFLLAARTCCRELACHPWFIEWAVTLQRTVDHMRHQDNP
jgi:hypothetical protein